jgi:hypothetical protein
MLARGLVTVPFRGGVVLVIYGDVSTGSNGEVERALLNKSV